MTDDQVSREKVLEAVLAEMDRYSADTFGKHDRDDMVAAINLVPSVYQPIGEARCDYCNRIKERLLALPSAPPAQAVEEVLIDTGIYSVLNACVHCGDGIIAPIPVYDNADALKALDGYRVEVVIRAVREEGKII